MLRHRLHKSDVKSDANCLRVDSGVNFQGTSRVRVVNWQCIVQRILILPQSAGWFLRSKVAGDGNGKLVL